MKSSKSDSVNEVFEFGLIASMKSDSINEVFNGLMASMKSF